MANEINFTLRMTCLNTENSDRFELSDIFDQVATGSDGGLITIGTSEEDLTITDVTTPGLLILRNTDVTNYVRFGPKSGTMVAVGRLQPQGLPGVIPLDDTVTITLIANTAPCKVKWLVINR